MNGGSERVAERLASMTREEKLRLVSGRSDPAGTATGYLPGVERLDVPPFRLVDGPLGIRAEGERATAFPASIAVAATFDPDLAREKGAAMAREARALEQDALLAPGANLIRVPHCGRNFEYYSEEPLLAAETAAGAVDGIQDEDVVATVKHYVANNQETDRVRVSSEVDERTLRKLYLRPFWAAVEAGAGSVMTAYNRVNGTYMSDHDRLVGDVLKGEWGFDGYVVSDWYGTESTVGAANAGLDLEMPGVAIDGGFGGDGDGDKEDGSFDAADLEGEATEIMGGLPDGTKGDLFGDPLADAIDAGEVPAERLDDMVRRILGQLERIGRLESADDGDRGADDARSDGDDDDGAGAIDTPAHRDLAERIAVRGTVLLENDGVLPLEDEADVAVVGPNVHEAKLGGGGSSETTPFRSTSPAAGLESRADGAVTVARGCEPIPDLSLFDALPFVESEESDEPAADARVGIDADEPAIDAAVRAAGDADVAVVFVRDRTTEGKDRDSLRLPGRQDELVEAVADAAAETVVVVRSSGPVELPWREAVDAVLEAWYPGQADGAAVASVLYGDRDPSGRLPVTFAPEGTYPTADEHRYPGINDEAHYEEGLFVGYRHFDRKSVDTEPTYPFGHGHSYADFAYRDASVVDDRTVRLTVENVADRDGREVVQAYVRPPESAAIERPTRELAGFESIAVPAGEMRTVDIDLADRALGRYDAADGWVIDSDTYPIELARSARDVRKTVALEVAEETLS
ncbi:glycoside hydrolase family 3 domain protein [Haloterrigena turkmenica DSM 5511]|uniref:Glycoside hydrolase family 3 domain protein n=1 Tax=Haloterrigena turkmenica (strain ATCC 51198 / DSM 5511 / JCM 9101 / NCIMB 13204 / VKM B-1734 / 4k) TaxID=543526 RepID=D2RTT8_HALTV|nr:glycoside hydrolase family 3 C-terminal domain-containing protein [Haloterrigena turkmenica]ADB61039.1 glycoside hydrolase family 3 domain protein [Haloterrigena turkmenica DSM 5511]